MNKRNRVNGFTLLETLTVLVILGILSSLAVASIKDYASSTRLLAAVEAIAADIRLARLMVRTSGESCYIAFDPAANSYTVNGTRYVKIAQGIRFGVDPAVTGKPTDPYANPPSDGITFESEGVKNQAHFYPKGLVVPTGAVYLTNGKETMAITVTLSGQTKIWRYCGKKKWLFL